MNKKLLIFSAPSGSGKSTIINWLMQHEELHLAFSISCTSRAPRGTEQNGVEYFFLSAEEFRQRIANDEFLEYEEVYKDRFYGTLKQQVENQLAKGENVVFDLDVKGGCNIKQFYGDRALSIFIQPPSIEELRRRLEGRATDTPEVINDRIARAAYELTFAPKFDRIVVNDDLEKAKEYLADLQFDNLELELSALDLHYLDVNTEAVKLLDEIRVISRPHGLDRLFPVTKLEIEKIRGVKSDHAVNKLVEYNLVKELGRLDAPGRPLLFGTTEEFLRYFGLHSLEDLPSLNPVQIEDFKAEAEEEVQMKMDVEV